MQNDKVGINFVNIPIEVFSSTELTANEKILYGYLSIFKKQCCFQSNEALAEAIGASIPTITNGLKHLAEMGYIFVEFLNNNNAKRRIYTMFDNPKKTKYLIEKGYLKSFPQSNKNFKVSNKNYETSNNFYYSPNGGESNKNYYNKIIKNNKKDETPALAVEKPSRVSNNKKYVGRAELLALEYSM